ncbi:MAG: hypothetical protein CMF61_01165 [Magnetococcales bacterium]|nr:hypothetical protein [Magnetococcales bacterium]
MKIILGLFIILLSAQASKAVDRELPVNITSERMEVVQTENKAFFEGDVKVTYGAATMGSNTLEVLYSGENEQGDVKQVTALGGVIIVHGESTATGDKAVFTPQTSKVLVTGNVVMSKEDNVLKGESLTYDLETGDMNLNNNEGDGRIKAIFTIKGKK